MSGIHIALFRGINVGGKNKLPMKALVAAFDAVQALAKRGALLSGHDVSDGGLLVALLEMAFAGDKGIEIDLAYVETGGLPGAVGSVGVMEAAFAEEVGMVVEVAKADADAVAAELRAAGVAVAVVGRSTGAAKEVVVNHVLKAGLGRITEDTPQYHGVVVLNMADVPLGFGTAAKSTGEVRKLDPQGIVAFHQADVGEYLRDEGEQT